jgi:hypothetical protein
MSDHDLELLRPECPSCGAPMRLSLVAAHERELERRTFECRPCGRTECYEFELATLRGRPKPIPTMWPPS